jgi:hypothetical protein
MAAAPESTVGWLAFLDVYGFSSLVTGTDNSQVAGSLLKIHDKILDHLARLGHHQFFSDSIFLFAEHDRHNHDSSDESLKRIISSVRDVISEGVNLNLFFRGSVAYGQITIGPGIILGTPILRAVQREQSLAYPTVVIPVAELRLGSPEITLPTTIVETKSGILDAAVILPSARANLKEKAVQRASETRVTGPDTVALAWERYVHFLSRLSALNLPDY